MSSGNSSSSGGAAMLMADGAASDVDVTPVRRRLGASTDDAAIFFEDTVDRMTAQCIDASPSALALLTPQRMPASQGARVDMTEYDASHLGSLSSAHRKSSGENSSSSSSSKGRPSCQRSALHDVTNTSNGKLNFSTGPTSKSPTPKQVRSSNPQLGSGKQHRADSHNSVLTRSTPRHSTHDRSPSAAEPTVPLSDYETLQKERNRFEKMYEHQRALYEEMAEKQADTYQTLQEKIIEVVALSTRNEESKRFIRQLKREFSESRSRVMDMQNKALEEARTERSTKSHYEALIREQDRKYERQVERHEMKLAGMESLVKDLTSLRGDQDQLHVAQLDSLLKAAYSKSTALFSDLLRQGRQIDLLYDAKCDLENQLEQLRREKREMEATVREERRRMMAETDRLIEQIEEQQQSILNLRQMLIRTMDNRDNVFAYSRGPRRAQRDEEGDEEDIDEEDKVGSHASSDSSSSSSSSPSSIEEEGEEDRSFAKDDVLNDGGDRTLHRESSWGDPDGPQNGAGEESTNPLSTSTQARLSRGGQCRPVISAADATTPALTSNAVTVARRAATPTSATASASSSFLSKAVKASEVVAAPPLPLSSRSGDASGPLPATSSASSAAAASAASSVVRQRQPYRMHRIDEGNSDCRCDGEDGSGSSGDGAAKDDDNGDEKVRSTSAGGITRGPRRLADSAATLRTRGTNSAGAASRENDVSDSGSWLERKERHSPSSASPAPTGAGSRRRLDFTTALAAVAEKRRRDREAREEGLHNSGGGSYERNEGSISPSCCVKATKASLGKENSGAAGGRRGIVRSGTVGSIATARTPSGVDREEDEEEEPRLFRKAGLCPREE
ncbi:hypothetical protein ABB37_08484 [Leptomonas pyrrhocoris]|uniref:Uncharacterized protein n=1 Tax=Leptomonas pyrrhocoris TaxID=157538 RepID=A0A0M9FTC2_LEPPY|nr:hypothetical protein ABB37_08484 [Leptomonas pyrrhocoris]XP_015654053.1 hypothetical protein ABB37_08484 [Leptomonas pyrrhocoris]KPA75613.1 hypothetical protein ABB37_08484 [Leptomonas pyrrhocoris]KPA75614.1 hypothetical protein ABB37_08484 [Leptomonas pyrrhocoris]|eukprot:XP_015654052.1 hypothetical protein ABB37_08484 [Leptomonas pyrrhocoris]